MRPAIHVKWLSPTERHPARLKAHDGFSSLTVSADSIEHEDGRDYNRNRKLAQLFAEDQGYSYDHIVGGFEERTQSTVWVMIDSGDLQSP